MPCAYASDSLLRNRNLFCLTKSLSVSVIGSHVVIHLLKQQGAVRCIHFVAEVV
jgi:hypothetical protein